MALDFNTEPYFDDYSAEKDFAPIGLIATFSSFLVVHPSVPARSAAELLAYIKANPKAVSFAESNVNAAFDLAEKLVHAKDVQEVMQLQTEYLKAQMATIQDQAKELGDVMQKAAGLKK